MAGELYSGNGRFNSWACLSEGSSGNGGRFAHNTRRESLQSDAPVSNAFNGVNTDKGDIFGETAGSLALDNSKDTNVCLNSLFLSFNDIGESLDFGSEGFTFGGGFDFGGADGDCGWSCPA